jgi:hypothetical protein
MDEILMKSFPKKTAPPYEEAEVLQLTQRLLRKELCGGSLQTAFDAYIAECANHLHQQKAALPPPPAPPTAHDHLLMPVKNITNFVRRRKLVVRIPQKAPLG